MSMATAIMPWVRVRVRGHRTRYEVQGKLDQEHGYRPLLIHSGTVTGTETGTPVPANTGSRGTDTGTGYKSVNIEERGGKLNDKFDYKNKTKYCTRISKKRRRKKKKPFDILHSTEMYLTYTLTHRSRVKSCKQYRIKIKPVKSTLQRPHL